MNKILIGIGWFLLAIGISSADSECLLIPTVTIFTGSMLIYFQSKKC